MRARLLLLCLLAGCAAPATTSVTLPEARGGGAIHTRLQGAGEVALVAEPGVGAVHLLQADDAPFDVEWTTPGGRAFRLHVEAGPGRVRVVGEGGELTLDAPATTGAELRLGPDGSVSLGPA